MSTSDFNNSHIKAVQANVEAHYILPSDASESERLRINHNMWRLALGGLQTAPLQEKLEKGIKVLDIGCGPGWWSIDMAKRHPNSKFVGLDISDSFPREEFPDNLIFKLANAGQGLPFDDDEFDYVFQRFLVMGLSVDQYTFVVDEIKRVLKPGGTVEILEMVSSYNNPSPYFSKLGHWIEQALLLKELDPQIARKVGGMLKNSGFTSVTDKLHQIPIGAWGSKVGELFLDVQKLALPAVMSMVIQLGIAERPTFIKTMKEAFQNVSKYNTCCDFHIVCAVKPT